MDYEDYDKFEVANLVNKYLSKIECVRGNCDSDSDNDLLLFDNTEYYKEIIIDNIPFIYTHGHMLDRLSFIDDNTYLLYGHTHRYNLQGNSINPGSVGMPRGGNHHTCIIYDNKKFNLFDLDDNKIIETRELL